MIDAATLETYFIGLQQRLLTAHQACENSLAPVAAASFRADRWQKDAEALLHGNGLTCIIENGGVFERGGVAFSHVRGDALPASASARRPELAGSAYTAMGVSLVIHPRNPHCPTAHLNVRALVARPRDGAPVGWFGGGMDLTPYYPYEDDIRHFHGACKAALAPFGDDVHARYKRACDEYFFIKHRSEARGVGGVFFDDLSDADAGGSERCFALLRAVGDAFADAYLPIIERRQAIPYGERERDFQAYRRGRYVEFNLVCDRGTLFGLHGGGRAESILMSLPPLASWRYDWQPQPGTPEARLYEVLIPRDWV